ncbi:MAG: ABC transporter permease [Acholeplasmatales bacterium]|jgi:oligopeptide transport system permease protein|nr:ABC transporter permease [Acholeplasmatales bacterium]
MFRYFLQRLFWVLIMLVSVLTVTFIFLKVDPEDPPTQIEMKRAFLDKQVSDGYMTRLIISKEVDPYKSWTLAQIAEEQKKYEKFTKNDGIFWVYNTSSPTDPSRTMYVYTRINLFIQYGRWVANLVTKFDWGYSTKLATNVPATKVLNQTFKYTIGINIIVILLEIPLGIGLGILAALYKNKWIDNLISIFIMVFISLPAFVVIMLMMKWFGWDLKWFPTQWAPGDSTLKQKILSYFIPVISLSIGGIASLTRFVRAELTEVLTSDFVLLARTKGLSKFQSIFRHGLRFALTPIIPSLILIFTSLLGGSPITEQVYGIPGAGRVGLAATLQFDINIIMYDTAFFLTIGLISGILYDMLLGVVDPRIRMGAKHA